MNTTKSLRMLLSFSEAAPKIRLQSKFPLPSGLARRESQALRLESGKLSGEPDVIAVRAQRKGTKAAKGTGAHQTEHTAFSIDLPGYGSWASKIFDAI
jgi:hypothetical protein